MTGQEGASLAEDDENDLNVSFSHDDVSMTGKTLHYYHHPIIS